MCITFRDPVFMELKDSIQAKQNSDHTHIMYDSNNWQKQNNVTMDSYIVYILIFKLLYPPFGPFCASNIF